MWKYVLFYTDNSLVSTYFTLIGGVAMTPKFTFTKVVVTVFVVVVGIYGFVGGMLLVHTYLTHEKIEIIDPHWDGWEERSWTVIHMAKDRPGWLEVRKKTHSVQEACIPYQDQKHGEESILVPVPTGWRWQMPFPGQKIIVRTKPGETPVFVRSDHTTRIVNIYHPNDYKEFPTVMFAKVEDEIDDPLTGIRHYLVYDEGEYRFESGLGMQRQLGLRNPDVRPFWVGAVKKAMAIKVGGYVRLEKWESDWTGDGQQFNGYLIKENHNAPLFK